MLRDRAALSSFETRLPVISNTSWADYVEFAQFFDFGQGWDVNLETPAPKNIYSVGAGLRWAVSFLRPIPIRPSFEMYYGYRLRKVVNPENSLQDHGFHLQFALEFFGR
jgi:hemolysin activation/secretion protein